jgi:hypothetical protein
MEILRFEEEPQSAPKRERVSRGWVIAGFVALVFGVGSAFASSTITVNSNNTVSLGQGVGTTVNCQQGSNLTVTPSTQLYADPTATPSPAANFYLSGIDISGVEPGCENQDFKVQLFKPQNSAGTPTQVPCQSTLVAVYAGTSTADLSALSSNETCDPDGAYYFRIVKDKTYYRLSLISPPDTHAISSDQFGYVTVEATSHSY